MAQKTHPIAQPAWLLTQAVTRSVFAPLCRDEPEKRMRTVSIARPSSSPSRNLRVKPSLERCSRAIGSVPSECSAASHARTRAGSAVMASRESTHSQ